MNRSITLICVLALAVSSPVYAWHHHHHHHYSSGRGSAAALGFLGGFAVGTMANRPPPQTTVVYTTPAYTAPVYQSPVAQAFWSQSDFVRRQIQVKLQQRGFYYSYIDGAWGPGTQSAFEGFASSTGNIQLLTSYAGANELIRMILAM